MFACRFGCIFSLQSSVSFRLQVNHGSDLHCLLRTHGADRARGFQGWLACVEVVRKGAREGRWFSATIHVAFGIFGKMDLGVPLSTISNMMGGRGCPLYGLDGRRRVQLLGWSPLR